MCHIRHIFDRCILAACLLLSLASGAAAQMVELTGQRGEIALTPELRYWGSLDQDPAVGLNAYRGGRFSPVLDPVAFSSAYAPETWFATELSNTTFDDGRPDDPFVLTLNAPAIGGTRVYLVRENGLTEQVLYFSAFRPFDPSSHIVTRLRSEQFAIAPGERVTLIGHMQLGPFPSFQASLFSPVDLGNAAFGWGVELTAFYAFSLSCLVFFFGFQAAMRAWAGAGAAFLFLMFLGMIAMSDGLAFRVLHPDRPELASPLSFALLFGISAFGFGLSATLLRGAGRRFDWALGLLAAAFGGFIFALFSPSPVAAVLSYLLIFAMIAALLYTSRIINRDPEALTVGAVVVVSLAVIATAVMIVLMLTGWGGARVPALFALKAVFALLLLATMTALTANVIALRKRHLRAVEDRITALEAEARRSRELLEAEREASHARALAEARKQRLAAASHDLRQPLSSLRMTFDAMSEGLAPQQRQRLEEAFDYLQSLSRGYVDETVPAKQTDERYGLSVPMQTVVQMFQDEAGAKGVDLRDVPSSVTTDAPVMPVMRILSNLVSNAVKYTEAGRVRIGVRRGGGVRIVVADTGPGLSDAEIAQFSQAYAKGEVSDGHGLGLAVCFELAKANGLRLSVASKPGKGSAFSLWLEGRAP